MQTLRSELARAISHNAAYRQQAQQTQTPNEATRRPQQEAEQLRRDARTQQVHTNDLNRDINRLRRELDTAQSECRSQTDELKQKLADYVDRSVHEFQVLRAKTKDAQDDLKQARTEFASEEYLLRTHATYAHQHTEAIQTELAQAEDQHARLETELTDSMVERDNVRALNHDLEQENNRLHHTLLLDTNAPSTNATSTYTDLLGLQPPTPPSPQAASDHLPNPVVVPATHNTPQLTIYQPPDMPAAATQSQTQEPSPYKLVVHALPLHPAHTNIPTTDEAPLAADTSKHPPNDTKPCKPPPPAPTPARGQTTTQARQG